MNPFPNHNMSEYPECEKLKAASPKSQAIGEFLDWLEAEKGVQLARYPEDSERLVPFSFSTERLLAEFFGIDLDKVEDERRAMLSSLQN